MEILEFVKSSEVDPVYFESSYYMMPEEAGRRPYALLTKALEESEYVAIAKLTMHNREYTVFLRPHEGGMMLHTMYYEEEVRKVEGFGAPDVELKESEVKVAHQLIEALATEWEPSKFKDDFQENLKNLIQTKLEGGKIAEVEKPKKLAPVVDLMAALKESLAQMEGRKKPAERRVKPGSGNNSLTTPRPRLASYSVESGGLAVFWRGFHSGFRIDAFPNVTFISEEDGLGPPSHRRSSLPCSTYSNYRRVRGCLPPGRPGDSRAAT